MKSRWDWPRIYGETRPSCCGPPGVALLKDKIVESLKFKVVKAFVSEVSLWKIYTFGEKIYI